MIDSNENVSLLGQSSPAISANVIINFVMKRVLHTLLSYMDIIIRLGFDIPKIIAICATTRKIPIKIA